MDLRDYMVVESLPLRFSVSNGTKIYWTTHYEIMVLRSQCDSTILRFLEAHSRCPSWSFWASSPGLARCWQSLAFLQMERISRGRSEELKKSLLCWLSLDRVVDEGFQFAGGVDLPAIDCRIVVESSRGGGGHEVVHIAGDDIGVAG